MTTKYIKAGELRHCKCGHRPSSYIAEDDKDCSCYCVGCGEQTKPMPTEQAAYAAWQNRETFTPASEMQRISQQVKFLRRALNEIIAESPKPKLPYAIRVVEIAKDALDKTA